MNSKGLNKHNAIIAPKGPSELARHAYSTGEMSPRRKLPLLLIKTKFPAKPESNGLNNSPSAFTGI